MAVGKGRTAARWLLLAVLDHLREEGWRIQPQALEDATTLAETDDARRLIVLYAHRKAIELQQTVLHETFHVVFPHADEARVRALEQSVFPLLGRPERCLLQALATGKTIREAVEAYEEEQPAPAGHRAARSGRAK